MNVTATVALFCHACRSYSTAVAPAELCPRSGNHVHIKATGDNPVADWYRSHHQPDATIIAVRKKGST